MADELNTCTPVGSTATACLYTEGGQWMQEWRDVSRMDLIGNNAAKLTLADDRAVWIRGGILVTEDNKQK